jgi:hypothetical protein
VKGEGGAAVRKEPLKSEKDALSSEDLRDGVREDNIEKVIVRGRCER